jgi:hypothetical protein
MSLFSWSFGAKFNPKGSEVYKSQKDHLDLALRLETIRLSVVGKSRERSFSSAQPVSRASRSYSKSQICSQIIIV